MVTHLPEGLLHSFVGLSPAHVNGDSLLTREAELRREGLWIATLDWLLRCSMGLTDVQRREHFEAVAWELQCRATLSEFGQAALQRGIQVLVFKGCALSVRHYLRGGQRSYGDIDLAVRPDHRATVENLLRNLHFSQPFGSTWYRNGLAVDLHDHPLHQLHPYVALGSEPWWTDTQPLGDDYGAIRVLPPEKEFVLGLFHGAKHAFKRATWVVDLWVLAQHHDPKLLARAVTRHRAGRHLWLARLCLCRWFRADFPAGLLSGVRPPGRVDVLSRWVADLVVRRRAPDFLGMLTPVWAIDSWACRCRYLWNNLADTEDEGLANKLRRLIRSLRDS